jgi:uncharacterized protein
MFKSRHQASFLDKIIGFFWPRSGWKRSTTYVAHRVARIKGSPYSIAAGFAAGAAISFTPFMGLHFVLGALGAWLVRGNILASAIGTLVGNPWTFPFIWIFVYKLGILMGAGTELPDNQTLEFVPFFEHLMNAVKSLNWSYVVDVAWPVFWPMLIGSIPAYIVTWLIFFIPIRYLVSKYHERRAVRRAKNSHKFTKGQPL